MGDFLKKNLYFTLIQKTLKLVTRYLRTQVKRSNNMW